MRLHEIITEERRVPCDKCGGSGNVEAHGGMPINFADKMWPDMETCPKCKGEGTIAMSDWWGWNTDLDEEDKDLSAEVDDDDDKDEKKSKKKV